MRIILSTFNKGGVGKTTLAVHLAGVLAQDPFQRVLLVDCVDQYDSVRFLSGSDPGNKLEMLKTRHSNVQVIWNPNRESLKKIIGHGQFDSIVLDLNSPAKDAVQAIVNTHPSGVFLPINRQALAIGRLRDTLSLLVAMGEYIGYAFTVVIVPMGSDVGMVKSALAECTHLLGSMRIIISEPIKFSPDQFESALVNGNFVWEYSGCEYVKSILEKALNAI